MSTITYIGVDGSSETIEATPGASVMRAAISNGVRGIIGECGGQAMCATCHVYVETSLDILPGIGEDEEEMLECTAAPRKASSRLSCQLRTDDFESITVQLPDRQV